MAAKARKPKKVVTTRFKKSAPKPAAPLKKQVARKPRSGGKTPAQHLAARNMRPSRHPVAVANRLATDTTKPRGTPKAKPAAPATAKGSTRTEDLKTMLRTPGGVLLVDVTAKFGWLAHSARAAISRAGGIGQKIGGVTRYSLPAAQAAE